jgi:hypothetical protein
MADATIASVLERYGAYNASLEREYVRAQQIPARQYAKPVVKAGPGRSITPSSIRWRALRLLRDGQWWTADDAARELGLDRTRTQTALSTLAAEKKVVKEVPMRNGGRRPNVTQRYRRAQD